MEKLLLVYLLFQCIIIYIAVRVGIRLGAARAVAHIERGFSAEMGEYPALLDVKASLARALAEHKPWYKIVDDNLLGAMSGEAIGRALHAAAFDDGRILQWRLGLPPE